MKRNLILCAVCAFLASCSSDDGFPLLDTSSYADLESVTLTAKPIVFDMGSDTRTSLTLSGNNMSFGWIDGDTIGLFPISPISGSQVYQVLSNKTHEGDLSATFDGGAWKLKADNTYAAYFPFQPDMRVGDSYDVVPVNMLGQKQVGKNSSAHLGAYDYNIAPASEVDKDTKNVNFDFDHVSGFMLFKFTMPAASWKKLIVEAESPVFITSAKLNILDGSLKEKVYSKTIELELENVITSVNEEVIFFLAVLPVVTGDFEVTAITSDEVEYKTSLKSKDVTSGSGKGWAATLSATIDEYDGLDYVDLGTGTLWARNNFKIGTGSGFITNSNGDEYYNWYGVEPINEYNWENYFGYDPETGILYSRSPLPDGDGISSMVIDEDDVAYMYGKPAVSWRIPTPAEMQSLIDNCEWTWTQVNGVNGYKVRSKTVPTRWIFLPALGSVSGTSITESGSVGYYWTSELDTESDGWKKGKCLRLDENTKAISSYDRYIGMSIRPVYIGE